MNAANKLLGVQLINVLGLIGNRHCHTIIPDITYILMFHRVHVPQCFSAYMFLVFPSVHVARVSKVHAAMFPSVHSLHSSCFCLVHNLCFLQYTFSSAFIVFLSSTQFGVSYSTQLSRISVFLFSTLFSVSYSTLSRMYIIHTTQST